MIDHFHRDAPGLGFVERARGVAIERGPGFGVDFGLEAGFERAIGVVGAQEVGVTHEETFFVVVGVNKPTGDAIGVVTAHLAQFGWKTSTPLSLT